MSATEQLTSGFDFAEAIQMAELTQRASQLFEQSPTGDAKAMYNAFSAETAWTCVFAVPQRKNQARVLILKNSTRPLFALVLAGPAASSAIEPVMPSLAMVAEAGQEIEVTNLAVEPRASPPLDHTKVAEAAEYLPIAGERVPPPRGARVYGEWLKAFEAIQDEIELYFSEALNELVGGFEVYVTGHGSGGCLAALCALRLKRKWEMRIDFPSFNLKLYNFGSPKIGNKVFVEYYNQQMQGFSYRVQNLLDATTYEPMVQAPFPYNLSLLLPGVDYVRQGAEYFTLYEHIGTACVFYGLGSPTQDYHFAKGSKSLLPLPFPHDAAGYRALLSEAQKWQTAVLAPAQQMATKLNERKNQWMSRFQKQSAELQKVLAQWQTKPNG